MSENIALLLSDVSRLMRRNFDARARTAGATRPQWQMLSMLARHEGINQGGLAELLEVESITLCRMADRLQDLDLIERRADPADRRAWQLFLTPKAKHLLEKLRPLAAEMVEDAMAGLTGDQREQMLSALTCMRNNLSRRPEPRITEPGVVNG